MVLDACRDVERFVGRVWDAVELVKTLVVRNALFVRAQVPFALVRGAVAHGLEHLGHRDFPIS